MVEGHSDESTCRCEPSPSCILTTGANAFELLVRCLAVHIDDRRLMVGAGGRRGVDIQQELLAAYLFIRNVVLYSYSIHAWQPVDHRPRHHLGEIHRLCSFRAVMRKAKA